MKNMLKKHFFFFPYVITIRTSQRKHLLIIFYSVIRDKIVYVVLCNICRIENIFLNYRKVKIYAINHETPPQEDCFSDKTSHSIKKRKKKNKKRLMQMTCRHSGK